ncbi:acyl-CoA dehydrogenase family protein [Desulfonema magnum]|uniref:Acyl-CoA dehydrogenase n=1 Tax=Desulfonema magnum TaxID=45655 RepID=A0A975BLD1_9BACT|nr:acyl-CoA dehydrogenase family protein [Desulfonema magnum]QTA87829.1 Acyl-CoA dehydrogenase [Desulfonema magnum]
MDFAWSEEQLSYKNAAVHFAQKELSSGIADHDWHETFSQERWQKCAEFGVLGLSFPKNYGGAEVDILTTMLIMEGLGYGGKDNGLLFALNAQMWAVQHPISKFGTPEQQKQYLPGMIAGKIIGAHGMSEPDSGSDAYNMRTRAKKCDGGYVLNGTKTLVTNAPVADLALVFAMTAPKKKSWGVSAFLIETGTPGFSLGKNIKKMGLRTAPMGELILQDCFVPEANRLGPENIGAHIFNSSMEWERACILGGHVGAMERQLEECVAYSRTRKQFDQPIGKFQAISNRLAEMKVRLETARLLLYKTAWLKKAGKPAHMEAAMAKLYLSEVFMASGLDAIRIHGGYGYTTEFEVERDLRDAIGGTLYSGTSDIQRNTIARYLGV